MISLQSIDNDESYKEILEYVDENNIKEALNLVKFPLKKIVTETALKKIFQKLLTKKDSVEREAMIAKVIDFTEQEVIQQKEIIFSDFSMQLAKKGKTARAIEIAEKVNNKFFKELPLTFINEYLEKKEGN